MSLLRGPLPTPSLVWARRVAYWLDERHLDPIVIARMLMNLAIDAGIGAIPLVGDIFDFVFKANAKNLALLETRLTNPQSGPKDWLMLLGSILVLCAAFVISTVALVFLVRWIFAR